MRKNWAALLLALMMTMTACGAMAYEMCPVNGLPILSTVSADEVVYDVCLHGKAFTDPLHVSSGVNMKAYNCKATGGLAGSVEIEPGSSLELHNVNVLPTDDMPMCSVMNQGSFKMVGGAIKAGEQMCLLNIGTAELTGVTITTQVIGVGNTKEFVPNQGFEGTAKLTLNDCNIEAGNGAVVSESGEVTINGGTYEATETGNDMLPSIGLIVANTALKITKGEFKGKGAAAAAALTDADGMVIGYELLGEDIIAEGSYIAGGALDGTYLLIDLLPKGGSLPSTGDESMLGAWLALLALAGAGFAMKRRAA